MPVAVKTLSIPPTMHPVTMEMAAIEVLDLALLHASNAWDALQNAQHELHDFLEARACHLFREAQRVAPETAKHSNYDTLRRLQPEVCAPQAT